MKPLPPGLGARARTRSESRNEIEPSFYAAATVLARKIESTSERLAARGVLCAASFTLGIRPEVAAMRASFARTMNATAPTEPSMPTWRGTFRTANGKGPTEPSMPTSRGGLAASPTASSTGPTEPSIPTFRGPIGGNK